MLDQPHPSWPIVYRGDPIATASFRLAMRVLKSLLSEAHERTAWDEGRVRFFIDDAERLRLERRAAFMARAGVKDGRFPTEVRHFRDAPYDNDEFMEQLEEATFWQRVEEICTTVPRLTQEAALARLRDGVE